MSLGGRSDRTGAGRSDAVKGSLKVIKYHTECHPVREREFGQLGVMGPQTGDRGTHRLENDEAQVRFPINNLDLHEN